jgi:hypothetical protein
MTTADSAPRKTRDALLRESKDLIAIEVLELCRELHIRAMLGGGPVLNAHGLLTPVVAPNASIVVDPASILHLRSALLQRGWFETGASRRFRILPSARFQLNRTDELGGLVLYSVIPGFFADPEFTFDLIWERHKEVPLRGHRVRALGRINSAILASHDGLDGRASRARSRFEYFVDQFGRVLNEREKHVVVDLIARMGGCAEMGALIRALGMEPCPFSLPSVAYVQWRLQVSDVSDQLRRAVALVELGTDGRKSMYASGSGQPHSARDVFAWVIGLPKTCRAVFGAKRRWARLLAQPLS